MEKQKLLDLAIFIDNEYLDKYIYLINNYNKQYTKFETQRHHIIPRAYFKHNKIKLDNSKANIVCLTYKDHILAHYYLYKCSKDWFNQCMLRALTYLSNRLIADNSLTELEVSDIVEHLNELYVLDKQNDSIRLKGGKWVNNNISQKYISGKNLQIFLDQNSDWKIGKLPMTEEQKLKLLLANKDKTKGRKTINNGIIEKMVMPNEIASYIELGWKLGRLPKNCRAKYYPSADSREKNRLAHLGRTPWNKGLTKETSDLVKKYSANNSSHWKSGHKPWNSGKHFSEESKNKMSEAAKKRGANSGKRIIWIEQNIIYNTIKEASLDSTLNLSRGIIFEILKHRRVIEGKTLKYLEN